jgi:hypothetical protein
MVGISSGDGDRRNCEKMLSSTTVLSQDWNRTEGGGPNSRQFSDWCSSFVRGRGVASGAYVEESDHVRSIGDVGHNLPASMFDNSKGVTVDEYRLTFFGGWVGENCSGDGQESLVLSSGAFLLLGGTCSSSECGVVVPRCFASLGTVRLSPYLSMK